MLPGLLRVAPIGACGPSSAFLYASMNSAEPGEPGNRVRGCAIIIEPHQTIVVEEGWQAVVTPKNHLLLERVVPLKRQSAIGTAADPVMLEIFNNLFMSIAEQMGVSLQNTAYSVNIKERLDFSCAIFASDGARSVRAAYARCGAIRRSQTR